MYAENAREFINAVLSPMGFILAVGIIHLIISNIKEFYAIFTNPPKDKKVWHQKLVPFYPGLKYVLGGLLVSWSAYIITVFIYRRFQEFPGGMHLNSIGSGVISVDLFLIAVAMFVFSGYSLTASAGSRWMVNLAKIFATIGVLLIAVMAVGPYLVSIK